MPRLKFLTASTFPDLMTDNKQRTGPGKKAMAIIEQHAIELLGFVPDEEEFAPSPCAWGKIQESNAIKAYERKTLFRVKPAIFKISPTLSYVGGTMDGLVGSNGGIETKSPYDPRNHIKQDEQLKKFYDQNYGYHWIYELDWIDFLDYDPRFPEKYSLSITRIWRNDSRIKQIEARCILAHEMALEITEKVRGYYAY